MRHVDSFGSILLKAENIAVTLIALQSRPVDLFP
jgi:hypothetical protein